MSLTQLILSRMLSSSAPKPSTVSKKDNDELTQAILEQCYLPFSAHTSSASDNAKVSILAESLLRLLLREGLLCRTPSLEAVIEEGILARENKSKNDKRKKDRGKRKEEASDLDYLTASGQRLRSLVSWIEQQDTP